MVLHGFFVPDSLLSHKELTAGSKYLYMVIATTIPGSITELSKRAGMSRASVSIMCKDLSRYGFVKFIENGCAKAIVAWVPEEVEYARAESLRKRRAAAGYLGEFLMKEWLNLLIADCEYVDNARPNFLRNPRSKKNLEYDRYYLAGVAFEFNGDQHYMQTDRHPDSRELLERQERDLVKIGLSQKKGIELVEVVYDDLTLEGMKKKIPGILRLACINENGPYLRTLTEISNEYTAAMRKKAGVEFRPRPNR
ncbi:MAG TPA: helix-turn-helix domain-containing protein [Firmicutes bacterium]|jgi:hypothetical protein|nr:helix-turn-helix domain-containing protein [Bacillota bacterium]